MMDADVKGTCGLWYFMFHKANKNRKQDDGSFKLIVKGLNT